MKKQTKNDILFMAFELFWNDRFSFGLISCSNVNNNFINELITAIFIWSYVFLEYFVSFTYSLTSSIVFASNNGIILTGSKVKVQRSLDTNIIGYTIPILHFLH